MHEFPWVADVESSYAEIRRELEGLRGKDTFKPFRQPMWANGAAASDGVGKLSHDAGNWNVFYLWLHETDFAENRSKCPKTVRNSG